MWKTLLTLIMLLMPVIGTQAALDLGGQAQDEFLPVDQAYKLALDVESERDLRLFWQITDGYYLYKKRFDFQLEDDSGPIELSITLPEGKEHEDEYFGVSQVYYFGVDAQLALERPAIGVARLKVTSQGCADAGLCYPPQRQHFKIDFANQTVAPFDPRAEATLASPTTDTAAPDASDKVEASLSHILTMMLLAFLGGSILNLMPCVFPVLSLKVFSFANGSEHDKHVHGWVYAAGVVLSFVAVAATLIALQKAGSAVGWGFQLQSPQFVALLAYLFFAMGLSLSGVVEFGGSLMGTGSQLAEREGYSGSFFTGVLATVVASPCTAPFMGTALGFAVTQPAITALSIFAALGAGMAAPMVMLSYSKTLRSWMPKPGAWMETFKQLLAFPLYATAIWLLWVAGRQTGVNVMAILLCGLLLLALGLWLWNSRKRVRWIGAALVILALAVVATPMLETTPQATDSTETAAQNEWSDARLSQLLESGSPVFVNVTADWCITCIANEQGALGRTEVIAAMEARGITYLKADWTHYNPAIAAYLESFGRNGIPLYVLYNGNADDTPTLLPQLLTPGILLDAFKIVPESELSQL